MANAGASSKRTLSSRTMRCNTKPNRLLLALAVALSALRCGRVDVDRDTAVPGGAAGTTAQGGRAELASRCLETCSDDRPRPEPLPRPRCPEVKPMRETHCSDEGLICGYGAGGKVCNATTMSLVAIWLRPIATSSVAAESGKTAVDWGAPCDRLGASPVARRPRWTRAWTTSARERIARKLRPSAPERGPAATA